MAAGALAVLLLFFENLSAVPEMLGGTENFVALDWLFSFALAALVLDRMIAAVKSLIKFEFDVDSITLIGFLLSVVTTLVTVFATPSYETPRMYNLRLPCVFS